MKNGISEERKLRLKWWREAVKRSKMNRYTPSSVMRSIDSTLWDMGKDLPMTYVASRNTMYVSLRLFEPDEQRAIIAEIVKTNKPGGVMWATESFWIDEIRGIAHTKDGSGLGTAFWTVLIPIIEPYLISKKG